MKIHNARPKREKCEVCGAMPKLKDISDPMFTPRIYAYKLECKCKDRIISKSITCQFGVDVSMYSVIPMINLYFTELIDKNGSWNKLWKSKKWIEPGLSGKKIRNPMYGKKN